MTTPDDDFISQLEGYLDEYEGTTPLPDGVRHAVRAQLRKTTQRAGIGPWRTSDMNRYLRFALAAAAVVVVAIIGYRLVSGSNVGGPAPSPSVQPSAPASPTAALGLPVGKQHVLWNAPGDIQVSVTIPHSLWFGEVGSGYIVKDNNPDPPDGAGLLVFQGPLYVYGDPCHWATTRPDTPAATVDAFLDALRAQPARGMDGLPLATYIGGLQASRVGLIVPNIGFSTCDEGEYRSWVGDPGLGNARYHQGPNQIDSIWVADDNGTLVVFDAATGEATPSAYLDEMESMVASAVLQNP